MQEISIRLFEGAYTLKPRAERRVMLLAVVGVVLQVLLLIYLAASKHFAPALVFVFVFNLAVPAYFFFNIWLDRKPKYRRHLTLTQEGVCYRSGFMRAEQEFDWEEVDTVHIGLYHVVFVLKNEEEHYINLERIQNDEVLQQVKGQIGEMVQQKKIMLR